MTVPIITIVIGEGASGGALGIGVGNKVYMMENSWYSVISLKTVLQFYGEAGSTKRLLLKQ